MVFSSSMRGNDPGIERIWCLSGLSGEEWVRYRYGKSVCGMSSAHRHFLPDCEHFSNIFSKKENIADISTQSLIMWKTYNNVEISTLSIPNLKIALSHIVLWTFLGLRKTVHRFCFPFLGKKWWQWCSPDIPTFRPILYSGCWKVTPTWWSKGYIKTHFMKILKHTLI